MLKKVMAHTGIELRVHGIVQGVGFRPYVYCLAKRYGLTGTVMNTGKGVVILAEGHPSSLNAFVDALKDKAPPLARISSLEQKSIKAPMGRKDFVILESKAGMERSTLISPDVGVCKDCLKELLDPEDRRYGYAFINCTNCGPRFTITESIPYDRPKTSMKVFPLCKECSEEYVDPMGRRFHAQANACRACGPRLSWHRSGEEPLPLDDPVFEAAKALKQGCVIAIKGIGGFHLAVDATSEKAVALLRTRKQRKSKPLAIMVRDVDTARRFCHVCSEEAETLSSKEQPIVLLRKNEDGDLASNLAPGIRDLGLMLPYTPLHHLLLAHRNTPSALVMTSGNLCDEPICKGNDEALRCLSGIADYFLLHDREIVTGNDDSVVKLAAGRIRMIRRSRGYVPRPIRLSGELPQVLACGGELKNTFCLARGNEAFLSRHIGDLDSPKSLDCYKESMEHLKKVLEIQPEAVVCDLHPDYLSSRFAKGLSLPIVSVQHHHAHAISVMTEHGLDGNALAVIMDGTGYGPDNTIWGGEILLTNRFGYRSLGRLGYVPLPGGDAATREPWRMGLSILWTTFGPEGLKHPILPAAFYTIPEEKRLVIAQMISKGFNSPATSSCGRFFDGIAAILGLMFETDYEAQAAMELESIAWKAFDGMPFSQFLVSQKERYPLMIQEKKGIWIIKHRGLIEAIIKDLRDQVPREVIALRFHIWLVGSIVQLLKRMSDNTGIKTVVLGGGCMQNALLLEGLIDLLGREGLHVYAGEKVPANDGGLSLGQVVVGGMSDVPGHSHAGH